LSYRGAIAGRDNDIAAAGVIYGSFSRYIPRATAETVVEWNYQINLKPWLSITPDLQYVVRPSGSNSVANALVLGMQVGIVF
jgi:porin